LGYLEYLPPSYGEGDPSPLLVFLHGAGGGGDGSETDLEIVEQESIPALIAAGDWPDDRPFVVLAPQYSTVHAEGRCAIADDVAAFVTFATHHYEIDLSHVYLTGISCGAIGIWDYLASHGAEAVAAAVPISGHAQWAIEEAGCAPLTELAVWAFHGAQDDIVPVAFTDGQMAEIRACEGTEPAELTFTVYPDADHNAWTQTYDLSAGNDIYAWMLEHSNN
jgi:predicted peptidase